jgi:flavodoxin-like protein
MSNQAETNSSARQRADARPAGVPGSRLAFRQALAGTLDGYPITQEWSQLVTTRYQTSAGRKRLLEWDRTGINRDEVSYPGMNTPYSDGPAKPLDFQEPYLRAILGFIGLTDIEVVHVEGVAMNAIGPEKAVAAVMARSTEFLTKVV